MLIATILFYGMVLLSIRKKVKFFSNDLYEDGWSFENTNAIRGIIAISIILCHLTNDALFKIPYIDFAYYAAFGVGVFFFLSGYAMQLKTDSTEGGYLKSFFKKRFSKILYPYIAFVLLYYLITWLVKGKTLHDIFEQYRWGDPVSNSWYVLAILVFYILFYFSNKLFKGSHCIFLICVFTTLYFTALIFISKYFSDMLCVPYWYYRSLPLFPIGCFVGKNRKAVDGILSNHYWKTLISVFCLFIVGYCFPAIYNRLIVKYITLNQWFIQEFAVGIFGTLIIMLLLRKISLDSKITQWLGKQSFEIYLIHGLVIECVSVYFAHKTFIADELFTLTVVVTSIVLSIPLKKLFDLITKVTFRKV